MLAPGAFVELAIRGVTTDFAPGPTLVELRSHGFPGFAEGVRTFVVDKRCAPMQISEPLDANDLTVELGPGGAATVELTWKVEHATLVQLSEVGEVPSATDGHLVTVRRDTVFVLTAYDAVLGDVLTDRIAITTPQRRPTSGSRRRCSRGGAILAWNGGPTPEGFAPCDGSTAGVPDLRGRFILGAGAKAKAGERGGGDPHSHDFPGAADVPATVEPEGGTHVHRPPRAWNDVTLQPGVLGFAGFQLLGCRNPTSRPAATDLHEPHAHAVDHLTLETIASTLASRAAPAAALACARLHHEALAVSSGGLRLGHRGGAGVTRRWLHGGAVGVLRADVYLEAQALDRYLLEARHVPVRQQRDVEQQMVEFPADHLELEFAEDHFPRRQLVEGVGQPRPIDLGEIDEGVRSSDFQKSAKLPMLRVSSSGSATSNVPSFVWSAAHRACGSSLSVWVPTASSNPTPKRDSCCLARFELGSVSVGMRCSPGIV